MIKIICFGKLKENYLINAVNDYFERINTKEYNII